MADKNCIIMGEADGQRLFWTGKRFAYEYPEGEKYTAGEALRLTRTTSFPVLVFIVANYGTADEVTVTR